MNAKLTLCLGLLLGASSSIVAQNLTVTGVVTEKATGYPAIGVSVLVKGTTNGTITSIDGDYTLTNVPKNATLVFSYVGMTTQEIPLNGAIEYLDTFMLTMAMTALGTDTSIDKFKQAGAKPFLLAALIYVWLVGGGYLLSRYLVPAMA